MTTSKRAIPPEKPDKDRSTTVDRSPLFDPFTLAGSLPGGFGPFIRILLNEVADEIAMNNMEGRLVYANRHACENTGYSRDELLQMGVTDIEIGLDLPAARKAWQQMPLGVLVEVQGRHRRKDGSEYPVSARAGAFLYGGEKFIITIIRDISVEKQVSEELGVLRGNMELVLQHAPAAIAVFDREMHYLFVSRRFCEDYKVDPAQIIGRSHYEVFPEIPEQWKETHRRCLAGATEKCDEDAFLRADGSLDWVQWEITPWHEADGSIGGVILFSQVISGAVEIRNRLAGDQKKNYDIFQKHTSIQMLLDPIDGSIVEVNEAAVKFYGWSAEELHGMAIRQINILPDDEILREMKIAGEIKKDYYEFRHRRKDGSICDVEVYSTPVEIEGRIFLHSIIQDVTTRKHVVKALQDSEKRFRDIIEAAPIGIFIQVGGKFAYANPAMCRLLGMNSPAEILGIPILDIVHPDYRVRALERIRTINEQRVPVFDEFETVYIRPDVTPARAVTTGFPINYMEKDGAIVYVRPLPDQPG